MTGRNERTIRAAAALAVAKGCVMCGGRAALVGMFIPTDSLAWGARPGAQRIVAYGLCEECHESTNVEKIEALLARGRRAA